ncbi:type II 3-dehydroquinate dehydratase [Geminicoccus flavidas]|uniref:type II 3-dehydroquinate dehydratase n=1 Tax=Geminicoccus flavidas TaxID=2506407 RepID=UPI0038B2B363
MTADAYIINPAGLTEAGVATKHALTETGKPYVEVHFANIVAPPSAPRGLPIGPWQSTFSASATGVMMACASTAMPPLSSRWPWHSMTRTSSGPGSLQPKERSLSTAWVF